MGCIMKCGAKIILLIMSGVYMLAGVFLFFFGLISIVNQNMLLKIMGVAESTIDYLAAPDNVLFTKATASGISIAILGLIVIALGVVCWIGACCGCRLCLLTYAIALIVVCALEIVLVVLLALQPERFESSIIDDMTTNLGFYKEQGLHYVDANTMAIASSTGNMDNQWDYLQIQNQCCGSSNFNSWSSGAPSWNNNYLSCVGQACTTVQAIVPLSCCKMVNPGNYPDYLSQLDITNATACLVYADPVYTHQEGCYRVMQNSIDSYGDIIIIIVAISLAIEIVNIVCACYVFKNTGLIM